MLTARYPAANGGTDDRRPQRVSVEVWEGQGSCRSRHLFTTVNESAGVRLIRMPIAGGSEQVVPVPSALRLEPVDVLSAHAIGRDGRIAVRVAPMDSWHWPFVIFGPATGRVQRIPGGDQADMLEAGWANDGRLVTVAQGVRGSLWRFRPENEAR